MAAATNPAATAQMFKQNFMWGRTTATSCAHTQEGSPTPRSRATTSSASSAGTYGGHGGSIDRHR